MKPDIAGMPVEMGRIEKELGKLWEESADVKTRASLINLVLYTESEQDIEDDTHLLADIASKHALRAIVVFAQPAAKESQVHAWINAHCHTVGQGKLQICSEQITFQLEGSAVSSLANIVFSHLETDLPLCFWWQTEFPEKVDIPLWRLVDRLIFDSSAWKNAKEQSARIREISAVSGERMVLCDLNWARLLHIRFAIASLFDHSSALPYLQKITHVELFHAPGARISALLLLGWLATRLNWSLHSTDSSSFFLPPSGIPVSFNIREQSGPPISLCRLEAATGISFQLQRKDGSEFYQTRMEGGGLPSAEHVLPTGKEELVDILIEELGRSGKHPFYYQALNTISPLLANNNSGNKSP